MSYQIVNSGSALKIIYEGQELSVSKRAVQEISLIREDLIKLDAADCHPMYLRRSRVSLPVSVSTEQLINELNTWITDCACCHCNEEETPPGER